MSLRPTESTWRDLVCDAEGCISRVDGHRPNMTLASLRSLARTVGWKMQKGRDLCPEHVLRPRPTNASWFGRPALSRREGGER